MAIVAVEITPQQILVAAAQSASGSRLRLNYVGGAALDPDQSPEAIAETLKEIVEANGWAKSDTVVVVSRSEGELREISLPPSPDEELPDMVKFKAKSDFASFNDRWLLDFVSLDADPSQTRRVLATAIPPEVADKARGIVEGAGLRLKRIVLRPFATIESLGSALDHDGASLIIHAGDGNTDLIVTKGNSPVSTRTIRTQGSQTPEAQSQKLISEVRRTLASLKRQPGVGDISKVILVDDPATNKHLAGNLSQRLGLEVSSIDPFAGFEAHKKVGTDDFAAARRWQYASLLGSLTDLADDKSPAIDFLNPTKRPEVQSNSNRLWLYSTLAGITALLTIGIGWWVLRSQANEAKELTEKLKLAQEDNAAKGVRPSVDFVIGRTGVIDNWKKDDVNWLEELKQFSQHFLTADDTIVESFTAGMRSQQPRLDIKFKATSNEIGSAATRELVKRPYLVDPKGSQPSADADYRTVLDAVVTFPQRDASWRKMLDEKARIFAQGRASNQPVSTEPVDSEAE